MPGFDKFSLLYTYSWTDEDKAKLYKHTTDDDIIDRKNGYQLLDFMNHFFKISGLMTLDSFHRLEKLIGRHLPEKYTTRGEMKNWLGRNWNKRI